MTAQMTNLTRMLAAAVLCLPAIGGASASADWPQVDKLTAADAEAWDLFGYSVAVSGSIAVIGAYGEDDVAPLAGAAYVFDATTGLQLRKLTALDGAENDQFGVSVAVSGSIAIIGAPGDDNFFGSAYLFDVTTGQQLFKLTAVDGAPSDNFGWFVAISGNTAIVGAWGHDEPDADAGAAYVFDVTTGQQLLKLTADDAAGGDWFGWAVAISGNTAIVGARQHDDPAFDAGAAYTFDVTTGAQVHKLNATDAQAEDNFGNAVAIRGNVAIIGAYAADEPVESTGAAYVFDVTTGQQLFKLTASDAAGSDWFGCGVAINGDTAIVGAVGDDDLGIDSGSAYLFDVTTGEQCQKLTADDGDVADSFGCSVAGSGNKIIVGAFADDDGGVSSGSAYVFHAPPTPTGACCTSDGCLHTTEAGCIAVGGVYMGDGSDCADVTCPEPCPGDVNGDGAVCVLDLLVVLAAWGACP